MRRRSVRFVLGSFAVVSLLCAAFASDATAHDADWGLEPVERSLESKDHPLMNFAPAGGDERPGDHAVSWTLSGREHLHTIDPTVAPAKFAQPSTEEEMPRPSFLDSNPPSMSIADELAQLKQRLNELETTRTANEDAIRTIIGQSFAQRGSNITDTVTFGGTLETLTFWEENFDGTSESDIRLDTFELDFEAHVNTWSRANLVVEYFDGQDFIFPTNEGDEVGVDRLTVRRGIITIGDTTRYPLFVVSGRDTVPFGISTGDPVTDVLTINDPLTVEVFETREDFLLFGFELPVPPPPAPVSAGSPPAPPAPRPILFNPLARFLVRSVCHPYCGPLETPPKTTWPPYQCIAPYSGAIYFYNGDTTPELGAENHIEQMGGTLGYRKKGTFPYSRIPWTIDCDVDATTSVFDTNFLQHEYRHFLDQIGFVPGMAAHVKSSIGPVGLVVEWNGAINEAEFIDDAGNPVMITPQAWQVALNYQFDWNPAVETIGAQGTYLALGFSQSEDLAGVTRIVDPAAPVAQRVGFVPERRFSVGIGEWVLEGLRVAVEYSYNIDYSENDGGTGETANGFFMQMTYEF